MRYVFTPIDLPSRIFPSDEEVEAARQRVSLKRKARWAENERNRVSLKVIRKPNILGCFCQLWQNGSIMQEYRIFPTSSGDFHSVKDFVNYAKQKYTITNLPSESDSRYYVHMLATYQSMGMMSMGVITNNGEHKDCYTVDDLIDAGFAKPLTT